MKVRAEFENVAQAFLELLALRGVDCFFANAGTDFASIVDAFVLRQEQGKALPRPLTIPHENTVVSMAHGYYLVTGKPQIAMVHVGVGTANGLGSIMAASRSNVPILFSAGRTPFTEDGPFTSRVGHIHWTQECFDQGGLVREFVKWDYELKSPAQLEAVVDRALVMSMTEPKGPVYLTLPREVLASPVQEMALRENLRYDLPSFHPDPVKIRRAADLLAQSRSPLIITSSAGRSLEAVRALVDLAEAGGVGVISFNPEYMNFPYDHPCHQGFSPNRLIETADLVFVVACDVPWYPKRAKPPDSAAIVQVGIDPFYSRIPLRSFASDLTIHGDPAVAVSEMTRVFTGHPGREEKKIQARRERLQDMHDRMVRNWDASGQKGASDVPVDMRWVSYNLNRLLNDETIVINEYDNAVIHLPNHRPASYFGPPHAGYLGWALGAALGVKLASPDKTVIVTVGDGCYFFGVPSSCHFVSSAYQLPILLIVYNNQSWHAVKRATLGLHPDGWAARKNLFPLSELQPPGQYEKICEAFGGYGERVEDPAQVGPALERALHAVKHEKRQALLNIICKQQ